MSELGATPGIVITPGVDDVLEAIEAEEDACKARQLYFEGERLTREQYEASRRFVEEVRREGDTRLARHDVRLYHVDVEVHGFGYRFYARNGRTGELLEIDYKLDDIARLDPAKKHGEPVGAAMVHDIVMKVLEKVARA